MSQCEYHDPQTGTRCTLEVREYERYCRGCEAKASEERNAFEDWMQAVFLAMEAQYGFHPDDLPDCPYADWHFTGLTPEEAAAQAVSDFVGEEVRP